MERAVRWAVIVAVVVFLGLFLAYPLLYTVRRSVITDDGFTLHYYTYFWRDPDIRACIANSMGIGFVVTAITAAIALPLSFIMVRYKFPAKGLLAGLLLVPMIMPPFVGAVGMVRFLGLHGTLNEVLIRLGFMSDRNPYDWLGVAGGGKFWSVVIVEALHLYPIMYLNFSAALANIDPAMEEAGVNMGSSGFRLFRKITLPLMMPGIFAGSIIVFIWSLTDLGTPLIFGYKRVIPVRIYDGLNEIHGSNPAGHALVVGLLIMTALLYIASKRMFGARAYQSLSKGTMGTAEKRAGRFAGGAMVAFILSIVLLAAIPHMAVIVTSLSERWTMSPLPQEWTLRHYSDAWHHDFSQLSVRNSLIYSSLSTLVDLGLGIVIAWILVRKSFKGSWILDALVMLPLAIPGIVLAFGYVAAYTPVPLGDGASLWARSVNGLRSLLDPGRNPTALLVIAYAIRRLPYMVRASYAGFQQVSEQLEEAAVNMGSPPLKAVWRITVPLVSANLIAGGVLVFAFAMLEVSDSLILAQSESYYPITKAIFQIVADPKENSLQIASALGVGAMVLLAGSLILSGMMMGRKMGQLFRI